MTTLKKTKNNHNQCFQDEDEVEHLCSTDGNVSGTANRKTLWRFLQKFKIKLPHSSNQLLGVYSKDNVKTNLKAYLHPHVQCNTICNSQKKKMETTKLSIPEGIDKESCGIIYLMEYYLVMKKNKNLLSRDNTG